MDEAELQKLILSRLGRGVDRNDLLLEVCQKANLNWPQAEALVNQVEMTHSGEIARRQSPWIFILSLGGLLIGLGWAFWAIAGIYELLHGSKPISPGNPSLLGGITSGAAAVQYYLPSLLGATGLCTGGLAGVLSSIDAWRAKR